MNAITTSILRKIQNDISKNGYSGYFGRNKKRIKLLSLLNRGYGIAVTSDFDVYLIKM